MIAGDHPHVDAGAERDLDRVLGLGPQRVDDADHRHEREVLGERHRIVGDRSQVSVVDEPDSERQDS